MLIIPARIVQNHGFRMVKQQNPAQKIVAADVSDQIRTGIEIPDRDTEMVISITDILHQIATGAGKGKIPDSRLWQTSLSVSAGRQ